MVFNEIDPNEIDILLMMMTTVGFDYCRFLTFLPVIAKSNLCPVPARLSTLDCSSRTLL